MYLYRLNDRRRYVIGYVTAYIYIFCTNFLYVMLLNMNIYKCNVLNLLKGFLFEYVNLHEISQVLVM